MMPPYDPGPPPAEGSAAWFPPIDWPPADHPRVEPHVVAKLVPKREQGKQQLLEVLDSLRQAVESGEVVAFAAVGIEADDCTRQWSGCTQGVTNLRMIGAVARLLHGVQTDTDEA